MPGRALSASIVPPERERGLPTTVVAGALTLAACLFVRFTGLDHAGVSFCYFKIFTGYACPTCGSTRAFGYLGRLDFAHAFVVQPLATLAAITIMAWALLDALLFLIGRRSSVAVGPRTKRILAAVFVAVTFFNWIYLIATGV